MTEQDELLLKHKNLGSYKQLGFFPNKVVGKHVVGPCPFCGKDNKFYVNPETKLWDCKSCTEQGGFKVFITKMVEQCQKAFVGLDALGFAKGRGLNVQTLKSHKFGFNSINKSYTLPIFNAKGDEIFDVRVYKDKKFMSLAGCNVGLFGWEDMIKPKNIYLCEGEWDKFAMEIMLKEAHAKDYAVVSVPGAGTFKQEWHLLFKEKNVYVMYDHDLPGKKGAHKVWASLRNIAHTLKFVHWPEDKKDGYDTRDYKIETDDTPQQFTNLMAMMFDEPPELPEGVVVNTSGNSAEMIPQDVFDGPYVPLQHQHDTYRKWLHLPSTEVLDVMYGACIANRLDGDPLWLFIVAPPGGTKTELINSISDAPATYTTSSLTPRSLVSGAVTAGGVDPSLIPKLNNKVLLVKDFTTILNMNQMQRDEIFGILRDAYDGKTEKNFGNGATRSYKSKFGLVSAVTPVIETYTEGNSSLGERFLRYNVKIPSSARARKEYMQRAQQNAGHETEMREELAALGTAVLKFNFVNNVQVPDEINNKTIALAQYVAKMRGTVIRDKFSHEITHDAFSELGTRLVKQFTKLMYGISMYRAETVITNYVYNTVRDMAIASVPSRLERLINYMFIEDAESQYATETLVNELGLPSGVVTRLLENLGMLGMVRQFKETALKSNWALSDDAIYLIEEGSIYERK